MVKKKKLKVTGICCPHCHDEIWSRHRHDMRHCECGYCYIDGGREYTRIGYGSDEFERPWRVPAQIMLEVEHEPACDYKPRFPY